MHSDPDYSAAYVILRTDGDLEGHGLAFTIGRGNDVCAAAIAAFTHHVVGLTLDDITSDFAGFWRKLASDSQLRWLGPEKGVIHLAMAAVVNAVWDLYAKHEKKPLWKLLAGMSPRQIVSCIDFRYITDALTPDEALAILERHAPTKVAREAELLETGYPGLYHVGRLVRIFRRADPRSLPRRARGWLDALQGQGRRPDRRRQTADPPGARGDRTGLPPDDRRQPAVGRRRGDRARAGARRIRPVVDGRTDQPGRRPRPCGDCQGDRAGARRHRRALREPRAYSNNCFRPARLASARSTRAVSEGSTRTWPFS